MHKLLSVKDKNILVTGGTRGIGKAIVKRLIEDNANVIVNHVRDTKSAELLQEEVGTTHVKIVRADLTREKGMTKLLDDLADSRLDGLIHCAATGVHAPIKDVNIRHWDWTMNLNVRAFFQLVTSLINNLTEDASIIALSSVGAVKAIKNYSLVGASKGALESLCRHMALEYGEHGRRFNILSPGSVLTDAWDAFPDKEERLVKSKKKIPSGVMVTPDEVAMVAHFLISSASKAINGQTIVVDKGERIVT